MKQTQSFQAEIKQLLDLVIHSLYSHKEIFLRELISNASDACDKRKFASLTNEGFLPAGTDLEIQLEVDKEKKLLKIIDNGVGMTLEEATKNLGTIAHSGTKELLKHVQEAKERPELIGQFGVGFYSAFMVADRVTVHTQKVGTNDGVLWESTGDGTFTTDQIPRPNGSGTTITLHLKSFEGEDDAQDFTEEWTLKSLIKRYSDFIRYPIKMKNDKGEWDVLNSQKALWLKSPNEITEEEYKEFYQQISHDWQNPLKTIHYKAEGTMEFHSLLFIPSKQPWNYYSRDSEHGLNLYVKRVFIMNNCKDLLPPYLRFVRGLVDSSDLSLNVSREMLQHDRQVGAIRKSLTTKVLNTMKDWLQKNRSEYESFWTEFGSTLKEGIPNDPTTKEKLQDLLLFQHTNSDQWITLDEYVQQKPEEQKAIYFLTGETIEQLRNSPYLEKLKKKGYNVLLCADPVDEWVTKTLTQYKDLKLQSVTEENLDLSSEEEKKEFKDLESRFQPLMANIKTHLEAKIQDVRLTDRLTETPACLVSSASGMSAHMEQILAKMGQETGTHSKRILEVNPKHPLIERMLLCKDDTQKTWSEILYNQALLFEGSPIPEPLKFAQSINDLMLNQPNL
jgi:molecular chaperone HtpG